MAPVESGVGNVPDLSQLPQLWLAISILLLLILLTVGCNFCKRFTGRQGRGAKRPVLVSVRQRFPTQLTDASPNGEFPHLPGDKALEVDDDLYEVISEVNMNESEPQKLQPCPSPGKASSAQTWAVASGEGSGSRESVKPAEPGANMAIYAKVVKQKEKGDQIEPQDAAQWEEEEAEPPPVPEKHLE